MERKQFDIACFTTVTVEADNIESARQLLKDKADSHGYINLSVSKDNDNGYIFALTTVFADRELVERK